MSQRIDTEILKQADIKDILKYLVDKHDGRKSETLQNYYEGRHAILDRQMIDPHKPNNRIVNGIPAYITDTVIGYFMGKPISYTGDETYMEALNEIFDGNDEQDHNSELAKAQSVKGCGYELLYTDEESNVRFADIPRESVIYVETADVESYPVMAIRIYTVEDLEKTEKEFYDVYTDAEVITYEKKVDSNGRIDYVENERQQHYFGEVPVVQYKNNKEMMGDFEGVITLIDAYNITQSDTANDFEYFTDAYLLMTGASLGAPDDELTDEQQRQQAIYNMKENRVIELPDKESSAKWLIKDINDTAVENYKNRLRGDIHTFAKVPDLSDDEFGTALSGVAIAYRMMNLEQVCATKERKFKKGLQRRIRLITNILNTQGKQWDYKDIEIQFSRNLPQNLHELAEIVGMLAGRVDDEKLISLLPFVEDPSDTLEKLKNQKEESVDLSQYMGDEPEDDDEAEA